MIVLKQNTATRITVGPFYDVADGVTPLTSLTATSEKLTLVADVAGVPTLQLDANATASGGDNDLVHVTGDDAGYFDLEITATQLNFVGNAKLSIGNAAAHYPLYHEIEVLSPVAYNRDVLGYHYASDGARIWYVSTAGNDSADGTFDRPLLTPGAAATAAVAGDWVVLLGGTFTMTATLSTTKRLNWVGRGASGSGKTTLTNATTDTVAPGSGSLIRDLEITCTVSGGKAVTLVSRSRVTFERCIITSTTGGGSVGIFAEGTTRSCAILGCQITGYTNAVALTGQSAADALFANLIDRSTLISTNTGLGCLYIDEHSTTHVKNTVIVAEQPAATSFETAGIFCDSHEGNWGTHLCEGVDIWVAITNVSATGAAAGIATGADTTGVPPGVDSPPHGVTVIGGGVRINNSGSGANYSLKLQGAASAKVRGFNTNGYASTGSVQFLDVDAASVVAKLPTKNRIAGSDNVSGDVEMDDATGNYPGSVASVAGNVGGNVVGSVGSLTTQAKADVNAEADQAIVDANLPNTTAFEARTLVSASYATAAGVQAGLDAINVSASRRMTLATVAQWERPESGSTTLQIEMRTFDEDGALVAADSTPTLTVTGLTTGSLSGNLSVASNPLTGVYRWTYTLASGATLEQARLDGSATIAGSTFTQSTFALICDFVAATFTTADRADLQAAAADAANAAAAAGEVSAKLGDPVGADFSADIQALPTAGENASAVRTELATELGNLDAPVSGANTVTPPTADQNRDAVWSATTISQTIAGTMGKRITDNLDAKVSEVEGGTGGGATRPVNQTPVPASRTWVLKATSDDSLKGETSLTSTLADTGKLWSVDHRNDLPNNGRLLAVTNLEIVTGTVDGITWGIDFSDVDEFGIDRSSSKFKLNFVTADTYVLGITASIDPADGGGFSYGEVTLNLKA